jgi:GNAT superfamily N-acetyltransferase
VTSRVDGQAATDEIVIVPFRDEHARAFDTLNREWLERFDLLEDGDLPYLEDPRGTILDKGGAVLCAVAGDEVVGTVAMIPRGGGTFELAKLAVAPSARRRGLGRRLVQAAIDFALAAGAETVTLSSNQQLREAIQLYESFGFVHTEDTGDGVAYVNANVFMRLGLENRSRS